MSLSHPLLGFCGKSSCQPCLCITTGKKYTALSPHELFDLLVFFCKNPVVQYGLCLISLSSVSVPYTERIHFTSKLAQYVNFKSLVFSQVECGFCLRAGNRNKKKPNFFIFVFISKFQLDIVLSQLMNASHHNISCFGFQMILVKRAQNDTPFNVI